MCITITITITIAIYQNKKLNIILFALPGPPWRALETRSKPLRRLRDPVRTVGLHVYCYQNIIDIIRTLVAYY